MNKSKQNSYSMRLYVIAVLLIASTQGTHLLIESIGYTPWLVLYLVAWVLDKIFP